MASSCDYAPLVNLDVGHGDDKDEEEIAEIESELHESESEDDGEIDSESEDDGEL